VVSAIVLRKQAIMALPKASALLFDDDRLQRRAYLDIARHLVHARPVVRRPR
jgi:hypothetical protein